MNSRLDTQEKNIRELKEKKEREKPLESDGQEEDKEETPLPPPKTKAEKRVEQLEELVKKLSENSIHGPRVTDYEIKGQLPKNFVITSVLSIYQWLLREWAKSCSLWYSLLL